MGGDGLAAGEVAGLPDVGNGEDKGAFGEIGGAGVDDDADAFVSGLAGGHWVFVPGPSVVDVVEVGAADGGHLHAHEDLVGRGLGNGDLAAHDVAETAEDCCGHG